MQLYPSLMACHYFSMADYIKRVLDLGVYRFHLDIMDGNYVDNFALTPALAREILNLDERVCLQIHLMCCNPSLVIDQLGSYDGRIEYYVHSDQSNAQNLLKKDFVFPVYNIWEHERPDDRLALAMSVPIGFCGQQRSFDLEVILKNTQNLQGVTLDGGLRHSDLSYLIPSQLRGIVLGSGIFQQSRSPITITDSIVNELGL